jgi:carboxymethylenebutenolidase
MACAAPELFAAIGTFAGNMSEVTGASCRPSAQLPLVAFNATGDVKVHYEGGQGRQGAMWSTDRTLAFFRSLDGCADRPIQSQLPASEPGATGTTRLQWTECRSAPVTLYRIEGGSHRIPESSFAADALWSFFRDKSRAAAPSPAAARPVRPAHSASMPVRPDRASVAPVEAEPAAVTSPSAAQEEVTFESHGSTLYGCITRPAGDGPFPAIIYNHGSEKDPERCGPPALVRAYADRGYLVFAFQRHGQGQSPGDYIGDLDKQIAASVQDPATRDQQTTLLQDIYNHDVVDAVNWLMQRPEVDRSRVAMTGVSYGGIQTLLTAQKGLGIRAFIPFAPGAMSWKNPALQQRLEEAVRNAKAPIYLAQAQNDYSLGPSQVLGQIIKAKGAPNDAKVYPAFGSTPQQGHAGFAVGGGVPIWSQDVFAFLDRVMAAPTQQQTDAPEPPAAQAARFGQRRFPSR